MGARGAARLRARPVRAKGWAEPGESVPFVLLALLPALAADPEPAPAASADPATAPPAPSPAAPGVTEVRESWSAGGRLVRRLTLLDGALVREETFAWTDDGQPRERRVVERGVEEVERWTTDGATTTRVRTRGEVVVETEALTTEGGRPTKRVIERDGARVVTTWSYDAAGQLVAEEERTGDDALVRRVLADRSPPPAVPVPFTVGLSGGVSTSSDVSTTSVTAGFAVGREPPPERYADEPLELSAYGSYTRASAKGTLTNDELKAGFGLDYNEIVGKLTAFLFTTVQRNPVANLDVDLVVAPIGLKYELVPRGPFLLDVSFAPVWNFRSIAVAAGGECDGVALASDGHCAFSKVRGSLRVRATFSHGVLTVKDVVELLPTLNPDDGDLVGAIEAEAIFRNTATVSLKVNEHLSVSESVLFTRDPLLAEQADCSADPEQPLCRGTSLQTGLVVSASYAF